MNKLIILLPALFIAGSISSVNATNENINKINIMADNDNIQLPKDEKGIHDLIFDKTKFKENQEKIFKYIAHGKADKNTEEYVDEETRKIYCQKIAEDYETRKIYCQEILELIIEENKDGNKMFINELLTDSNLTKGIIHMMAIIDMDKVFWGTKTENSSDKNFIFENQYTLLSYIIKNKDKIINDKDKDELINEYIQEMFSAVFSYMYHEVEDEQSCEKDIDLINPVYPLHNNVYFSNKIVDFFENITDKALKDKDKNLVLQKILEYMYQKFYKPYKEFMNNDLDINKSAAFKEFAEKVFGNYNMMYMVNPKSGYYTSRDYNDTEKYASNTYNTLLMLSIYNRLVISFTKNKLKFQKPFCECNTEYVINTIFDAILKLKEESNNKTNNETNEMLMSFYLKTLFLIIYNENKIDDSKFLNDLLNTYQPNNSKIIYDLLNEYQMNCFTICNEYNNIYNNIQYDKRKLYFLNDECKSEYYAKDSDYHIGKEEQYNYYGMLLIDDIKFLLNLFDNKIYESIDIEDLHSSLAIPMPLMYIKLITRTKSRWILETKSSDEHYGYDHLIGHCAYIYYEDELKNFNYKFLNINKEIKKHLCNNNSSNNKESNKIEKKNNIIEENNIFNDNQIINNKNEINLNSKEDNIDNKMEEENDIFNDNQIINQIIDNQDFVYLVIAYEKYKEINEKIKNLNDSYENYCNNNNVENRKHVFRELLKLGYNSQLHGDWEECAKKCSDFYKSLIKVASKNGIE